MKRFLITILLINLAHIAFSQDRSNQQDIKRIRPSQVPEFNYENTDPYKHEFDVGGRLNTNGWSVYLELEKQHNEKIRNLYQFEVGEIKHPKEDKRSRTQISQGPWGPYYSNARPYVYGKRNVFYQIKLGYGQRRTIGGKGTKNGVEVSAIYMGGISIGLIKPYYLELVDSTGSDVFYAKYSPDNEIDFLDPNNILAGGGFKRGWNEVVFDPGLYARLGMRFDWAEFNRFVSAVEVGLSGSFYAKEVQIMVNNPGSKFFYGAYVSLLFGKRW